MSVEPANRDASASPSRRTFLGAGAAALAGVGLVRLAAAATADNQLGHTPRYGLLVDVEACVSGCDACVQACDDEHGLHGHGAPLTDAQWLRKVTLRHRGTGRTVSLPVMCQHCDSAPCVDVCPTGASFKRFDGIVLVDKHICIGCRYCMMACPFRARSFIHEVLTDQLPDVPRGKGTVESCTLCVHRIDDPDADRAAPRTTACAEACASAGHNAITFGDLAAAPDSPQGALARRLREEPSRELRPDLELGTGVRYQGI